MSSASSPTTDSSVLPRLFHGRPEWPTKDDQHLFWVGLRSSFRFAHHPAQAGEPNGSAEADATSKAQHQFFCAPRLLREKLLGVLEDSHGGSILVTGYRGTGKTSLVSSCRARLEHGRSLAAGARMPYEHVWWLKVNLSTVSSAHEVLQLTYEALLGRLRECCRKRETVLKQDDLMRQELADNTKTLGYASGLKRPIPDLLKQASARLEEHELELEGILDYFELTGFPRSSTSTPKRWWLKRWWLRRSWLWFWRSWRWQRWMQKEMREERHALLLNMAEGLLDSLRTPPLADRLEETLQTAQQRLRLVAESLHERISQLFNETLSAKEALDHSVTNTQDVKDLEDELTSLQKHRDNTLKIRQDLANLEHSLSSMSGDVAFCIQSLCETSEQVSRSAEKPKRELMTRAEETLAALKQLRPKVEETHKTYIALQALYQMPEVKPSEVGPDTLQEAKSLLQDISDTHEELRSKSHVRQHAVARGLRSPLEEAQASSARRGDSQHTYERDALSHYQTQLVDYLNRLPAAVQATEAPQGYHFRVVFVFDELDKLQPSVSAMLRSEAQTREPHAPGRQVSKLEQLQGIVAELKFFLTESRSHQIFIAGKDVDDSWSEDQNKGEGLFESIFACNIYVPSIFSTELEPCAGGPEIEEKERLKFYTLLARELGIPPNSWAFNTSLLILPHLAEYEIYHLILRAYRRLLEEQSLRTDTHTPKVEGQITASDVYSWVEACYKYLETGQKHLHANEAGEVKKGSWPKPPSPEKYKENSTNWATALAPVMSERTCRRLRILLAYLTYKGRGIPRKILREFYDMVQNVRCVSPDDPGWFKATGLEGAADSSANLPVRYVLAFPQHHLQKMNFYAGIVEYLDQSLPELRGLNDKGRVSIYHIIDYVLKFYATGFSQRDIEHANFMTTREEFFPSRRLAALILRVLESRLWKRRDSRSPGFRLLHTVSHDLAVMYLRYAPEQMELRHTQADFRAEMEHLQLVLADIPHTTTEQRLTPVHAQMRMARILDLTGRHFEARLAYFKALRWLRMDIHHFETALLEDTAKSTLPLLAGTPNKQQPISATFVMPFVTHAIEVLLALGRLNEEMGEHRAALQLYHEAMDLHQRHASWVGLSTVAQAGKARRSLLEPFVETARALYATLHDESSNNSHSTQHLLCLEELVADRGVMRPLDLQGRAAGYAEACNHSAIAYSKLWERVSANTCLLNALLHLHQVGDEYAVVDQLFFIGQIMVRRRDFHAAALWYLEALRRVACIRRYSDRQPLFTNGKTVAKSEAADDGSEVLLQSGAAWQTPSVVTSTEAQILAALGDVWYATGGLALLSAKDVGAVLKIAPDKPQKKLRSLSIDKLKSIIQELDLGVYDDRPDEYFYTCARMRYQSVGDQISANDVYLRQLEFRQNFFHQSASRLDTWKPNPNAEEQEVEAELQELKYSVLNSWTCFWHGARVLMHANLGPLTALTRDRHHEWGRISDFRRMGILLRLVGDMLVELTLHPAESPSRLLLCAQTRENNHMTGKHNHGEINSFCGQFIADIHNVLLPEPPDEWTDEMFKQHSESPVRAAMAAATKHTQAQHRASTAIALLKVANTRVLEASNSVAKALTATASDKAQTALAKAITNAANARKQAEEAQDKAAKTRDEAAEAAKVAAEAPLQPWELMQQIIQRNLTGNAEELPVENPYKAPGADIQLDQKEGWELLRSKVSEDEIYALGIKIIGRRLAVNRATRDIRTIFAFVSDKPDLLADEYHHDDCYKNLSSKDQVLCEEAEKRFYQKKRLEEKLSGENPKSEHKTKLQSLIENVHANARGLLAAASWPAPDLAYCGFRTLLFRLNGDSSHQNAGDVDKHPLPLAHVLKLLDDGPEKSARSEHPGLLRSIRLLALSEKALLSSYLCMRDTIPDFSYANTVLSVGQLYVAALYLLGLHCAEDNSPFQAGELLPVLDHLLHNAKRFLVNAVEVLKREQEQNRNTFHLLAVAWFGLGDIMLLRLAMLPETHSRAQAKKETSRKAWIDTEELFGAGATSDIMNSWSSGAKCYGDTGAEDVRRQAWENYRQGLLLMLTEMDQHTGRYRFPPDVYHAHGNVMDAVLHFRICKATRVRHSGSLQNHARIDTTEKPGFDQSAFKKKWRELAERLSQFESPQRFDDYSEPTMRRMVALVNTIRTDRSPFVPEHDNHNDTLNATPSKLRWQKLTDVHVHNHFEFFHEHIVQPKSETA